MNNNRNPYIRVPIAIAIIVMLFFLPTREFLKMTFILGIPFIFVLGYMIKQPRYSWSWNLCAVILLAVTGIYVYGLIHLPERVEVHYIVANGAGLVAEGKYDEAIALYERLDDLGQPDRMVKEIDKAQHEKEAHLQLDQAQDLIANGQVEEARQVLDGIATDTRAGIEAQKITKKLQ